MCLARCWKSCVKLQLQKYLVSNSIISTNQFGFCFGRNTSVASYVINEQIFDSINNKEKTLIVFIDLAKPFDSLNRNILFSKLECAEIRGTALNWFISYLSDRQQVVSISNVKSHLSRVDYGVVQGSNLGPLLFLIYFDNMDNLILTVRTVLFADETTVIFKVNT